MKKQILAITIIFAILWVLSFILAKSEEIGLCLPNEVSCGNYYDAIATPFFICMPVLFIISLLLLFLRDSVYLSWRKFALWAVPISAIILLIAPSDTPGSLGLGGGDFTKETASWAVAILFLIISLFIIIKKSLSGSTTK